ncbi:MAG: indole-3-glycerol phosphate synthase TrpC [Candidatus Hydrogenedentes bacterium]|nr:indole-3-glycerol phosphate synthase TrpC [Candidatus Hydrogenedentota bacterium]
MVLDEIIAHKREEVISRKAAVPQEELEERIKTLGPPRDFRAALRRDGISLIAEIKRASPSRGDILPGVDAVELGALYELSGARAISVLTDSRYFQGSLNDLTAVRQHVRVPCLRKDFVVDAYQVYEARAAQADAVLLIVRILTPEELGAFLAVTRELGMHALVEAHNADEIARAIQARAHIIGINNRDLDTLEVDFETTLRLKRRVPGGHVLVSESGIHAREQVKQLEAGGVDAILVGESLMTSADIQAQIRNLLGLDEG